ncbi:MAG TPA: aminopeptidase P N-terminal domain-containing protein [Myxococcota bacterium]|nr:aminopeptidase P N-terminal domain-containing protein [Myxococcota bacterium]
MPVPDFAAHRRSLLDRLAPHEAVLLFASPPRVRSHDTEHRYRPDSDVWWLTGWPDAEAAVLLRPGDAPFTLFVQPRDPLMETWNGRRPGPEGAKARWGADQAFPIEDLAKELPKLLEGVRELHYAFGREPAHDRLLLDTIQKNVRASRKTAIDVPETFHLPSRLLQELRLRKQPDELAVMREAARVTAEAHVACMQAGRPGTPEQALDAILTGAFRRGGDGPGYTNIVAAGDNATILHYVENNDVIEDGELVLIDAGCEHRFYTADVTRTWPANGRFTPAQRAVYEHVLDAQLTAIDACRAGRTFADVHLAATRRLVQGMIDLGLVQGDVDGLIEEEKTIKRYYPHHTSHWLGIDVHDPALYARHGTTRVLEPGFVLTVEPGLYIPADDEQAPAALRGIGVRIEDDIHVTEGEPEGLTFACPKRVADLEDVCRR